MIVTLDFMQIMVVTCDSIIVTFDYDSMIGTPRLCDCDWVLKKIKLYLSMIVSVTLDSMIQIVTLDSRIQIVTLDSRIQIVTLA